MMKTIGTILSGTPALVAAALLLAAFCVFGYPPMGAVMEAHTPAGGAFDIVFFYTPAEALAKASLFDAVNGEAFILAHWTYDLAFPLAYGFFCASAWAFGLRLMAGRAGSGGQARGPLQGLVAVPLAAVAFDLCENTAVSVLVAARMAGGAGGLSGAAGVAAFAASAFTLLKWIFVVPSFAGAVALPVAGLALSASRKRGRG